MKIRYKNSKNIDYLVMGICHFKNNKESHYLIEEEHYQILMLKTRL